jgi:endonuclease IV
MSKIKLGCHVGMAGKEMFLASAKEAASYGANVFMLYTGAPQNTRRKDISELNIEAGWEYARQHGIEEIVVHAPYIINLLSHVSLLALNLFLCLHKLLYIFQAHLTHHNTQKSPLSYHFL